MSTLAHRIVGEESGGVLYVLHGFLGSGSNWSAIARRLVDRRHDWQVLLVDLRLHGDSRSRPGPHDIDACADDVRRLWSLPDLRDHPTVLLGHSFGGKVALAAMTRLAPPPAQTWVIDSTPDPSSGEESGAKVLDLVEQSPAFASRDEAVNWIVDGGYDEPTARWMAMNLRRDGERWTWQLDVAGLRELAADFARSDQWSAVESAAGETEVHFVRAERDSIMTSEARARAERLEADGALVSVTELPGGHWLHVDNPDGLVQLLVDHLPRV